MDIFCEYVVLLLCSINVEIVCFYWLGGFDNERKYLVKEIVVVEIFWCLVWY